MSKFFNYNNNKTDSTDYILDENRFKQLPWWAVKVGLAITRMGGGGALALAFTNILVFRYKGRAFNEIGHKNEGGAITRSGCLLKIIYIYVYCYTINIYIYVYIKFHLENKPRHRCLWDGRARATFILS